jgi:hypothetical protein
MRPSLLAVLIMVLVTAPATAQGVFEWKGQLAAGKGIEIRGINGDVLASAATGSEVQVTAVKRAHRRGDPEDVRIEVVEHADGVTICAIYPPGRRGRENECAPGGGHQETRDNDVSVEFTVRVPAGVRFFGNTVNGDVEVDGLRSDAEVSTVNGSVDISTTGYAEATTVNGSIEATLGSATWPRHLDFRTVNGGITLRLPADTRAEVEAETVNGDITTDFPLTVSGRFGPRRVNGTIGGGGSVLALQTVNGSIRLRKTP